MGSQKSQIAQGVTVELLTKLLLSVEVADNRRIVTYEFVEDLQRILGQLRASHSPQHEAMLEEANARAQRLAPAIVSVLDGRVERLGAWREVDWVGRDRRMETSVADLRVLHERGKTEFSLKSTTSGAGTTRNVGGARLFAVAPAVEPVYRGMRTEALSAAVGGDRSRLAALEPLSDKEMRAALTDGERTSAKEAAGPFMRRMRDLLVEALNALPVGERNALVSEWLAADQGAGDLFIAIVTEQTVDVYPAPGPISSLDVRAIPAGDNTLNFEADGTLVLRCTLNCTNGVGLSPLALRTFSAPRTPEPTVTAG